MKIFLKECCYYVLLVVCLTIFCRCSIYVFDIKILANISNKDLSSCTILFVSMNQLFNYFKEKI